MRLIKLIATRCRENGSQGEHGCSERYHLQWVCETAVIYRAKTNLVVTVS